ncbi:MAG: hypothetical protein ABFC96_02905 [Thermoguttaceae bacterium]
MFFGWNPFSRQHSQQHTTRRSNAHAGNRLRNDPSRRALRFESLEGRALLSAGHSAAAAAYADPTFTLNGPIGKTYTRGESVTINWTATNGTSVDVGKGVISLCYDTASGFGAGNVTWIEVNKVGATDGAGSFKWDTAGIAPGTYYIGGYLYVNGAPIYSHLTQPIVVKSNAPTATLTSPGLGTATLGQNVQIAWNAANIPAGSTISLCYDTASAFGNGNVTWIEVNKVAASNGNGSYQWDTTGIMPGVYYVGGYVYANGTPHYFHSTQPISVQANAMAFSLTGPGSGTYALGDTVQIQWDAANLPAGTTVSLCYDTGSAFGRGNATWIEVNKVAGVDGSSSYAWNTGLIAPGTYYIGGYAYVNGTPVYSHLSQPITVETKTPAFSLTAPTSGAVTVGQTVTIQWDADNVPAGSTVSLCYDTAPTFGSGNVSWIEISQVTAVDGSGSYVWNTSGIMPGSYYIGGYLYVNNKPVYSHLNQPITVQPAASSLAQAHLASSVTSGLVDKSPSLPL